MAPGGGSRRSLGTKPNLVLPKRISSEKPRPSIMAEVGMSRALRPSSSSNVPSSGTRIPRPSMKGGPPSHSKRTGGPLSASHSKRVGVPKRSVSASHRPMATFGAVRSSSAHSRTPVSALQANRYSMSSNRGSHIGAKMVKDGRNLNDKAWQGRTVQEIMEFLSEFGYPKEMSASHFPLSTTDFKGVFEFLVNFIIPGYEIGAQRLELSLPNFLKQLGYPTQISKSSFQTLGTKHSWPSVLGVLDYLLRRAQSLLAKETHISAICFPNKDENGFDLGGESNDRLLFECFIQIYDAFNCGQADFGPQLDRLRLRLMESHGIDQDSIRQLEKERKACQEELRKLEDGPNRCEALLKRNRSTKTDLETMSHYLSELRRYNDTKMKDLDELRARQKVMGQKQNTLEDEIAESTQACLAKGIDPEASNLDFVTQSLQSQIQSHRELLKIQDTNSGSLEIRVGKKIEETDTLIREYNKKLLALDLEETLELRMDRFRVPQSLLSPLQNLLKGLRAEESQLERGVEKMGMDMAKVRLAIKAKEEELEGRKAEFEKLKSTLGQLEADIQVEDSTLSRQIGELKTKLIKMKENKMEGQKSLGDLRKEVDTAERQLAHLKKAHDEKMGENVEFMGGAITKFQEFVIAKEDRKKDLADLIATRTKQRLVEMRQALDSHQQIVKEMDRILQENASLG
eukprot:snap_masked-scaffold19_size710362-processed-gene-1.2 protein:Tk00398 transcript:snap_masked-scaffold19_size710362-processed-gene-1.2-mRNA-1 annotation:"kinetochore protein ndc80 homolog"